MKPGLITKENQVDVDFTNMNEVEDMINLQNSVCKWDYVVAIHALLLL